MSEAGIRRYTLCRHLHFFGSNKLSAALDPGQCVKHGGPEINSALPAPAADAPQQAVSAVGISLQPITGPGRHSQDNYFPQRWESNVGFCLIF